MQGERTDLAAALIRRNSDLHAVPHVNPDANQAVSHSCDVCRRTPLHLRTVEPICRYRAGLWIYAFGGIYSLLAAYGASTSKRWARPFIYSLGVLLILEWLIYTIAAYRSGAFHPGSVVELIIALIPGALLATLIGYCCYVVDRHYRGMPRR